MIYELVKEKDEEILKHITHVESERVDKPKSLTVRFHFAPDNGFFDNENISLKLLYKADSDEVSET